MMDEIANGLLIHLVTLSYIIAFELNLDEEPQALVDEKESGSSEEKNATRNAS